MGRVATLLLVLIVAALAARVLFVDARNPGETELPVPLHLPSLPGAVPEPLAAEPRTQPAQQITVVDPDPDLDQDNEPADCQAPPELPLEPPPESPPPH